MSAENERGRKFCTNAATDKEFLANATRCLQRLIGNTAESLKLSLAISIRCVSQRCTYFIMIESAGLHTCLCAVFIMRDIIEFVIRKNSGPLR